MSKWISVKDKLPTPLERVLVYRGCDGIDIEVWVPWTHKFACDEPYIHEVTHWMPLPEPPKED